MFNDANEIMDRYGTAGDANKRRRMEIERLKRQAAQNARSEEEQKKRSIELEGNSKKNLSARDLIEKSKQEQEQANEMLANQQQVQAAAEEQLERLPGETDDEYRRRQKIDKLRRGDFGGAAKQHAKDYLNKQPAVQAAQKKIQETKDKARQKVKNFANQKVQNVLNKNPKLAKAYNSAKEAKTKADEIKKRAQAINKKVQELKNKFNIKKRAEDKVKQLAARLAKQIAMALARAVAQLAVMAAGAAVGTIGVTGVIAIIVVIVIIAVVSQTCNDNAVSGAICNAASWIGSKF